VIYESAGARDSLATGLPDNRRDGTDTRLELIPDRGHFFAEERPDQLVQRLSGFFNG